MDKSESNNISSLVTNMEWVKKTLNDISSELKAFPMAIDAINKRIDTAESSLQTVRERLDNHLIIATEQTKELQANTDFRKSNELLIRVGKYLVPSGVALQIIVGILIFFKDKI